MRKLLFLPLVLFAINVFGQTEVPPPGMPDLHFIVAVQIGTDTIKNGIDTVKLTEETIMEMSKAMADSNYVVTLTPIGNCGPLNLVKITPSSFIVKEQNSLSGIQLFDYIVFAKQKRPMMPVHPRPQLQQPPAAGQH